ncbi:hypothetical protein A0J61_08820 [Choanephora cucurbitarum]|uniref:Uncharacterized protein n=1 Tax=Choanephora cucurbitarum TaxID=101091 RepID=A0A1C7N1Z7_9FUNG|nr:hypothetical protein A0J61_08820 [Choanephora cucurbitarum]
MQYVQSLNLASQSHLLQDISLINLIRSRTGLSIVYLMALNALLSRLCFILQNQAYSMPNFYFDSYIIHQTNSLITYCLISASHVCWPQLNSTTRRPLCRLPFQNRQDTLNCRRTSNKHKLLWLSLGYSMTCPIHPPHSLTEFHAIHFLNLHYY